MKRICITLAILAVLALVSYGEETEEGSPETDGSVAIVAIDGEIVDTTAIFVRRSLRSLIAREPKPDYIIIEIDTPGGLLDTTLEIRKMIDSEAAEIPTVAYITNRAWSAGVLIALACDKIYIAPGGSLGSAVTETPDGGSATTGEKLASALRTEFRSSAEAGGRNPYIAAAIVDIESEIIEIQIAGEEGRKIVDRIAADGLGKRGTDFAEIRTISVKGELLNLGASEAVEIGFLDGIVEDRRGLFWRLGLGEKPGVAEFRRRAPDSKWHDLEILEVVDGDTIEVQIGDKAERVKLLNIDTPEKGEPGYEDARIALKDKFSGKRVNLAFETPGKPARDKYGRLLAYLYVTDRNVNIEMVRGGWSEYWVKDGESRFAEDFRAAETEAKKAKRGIWSEQISEAIDSASAPDDSDLSDWVKIVLGGLLGSIIALAGVFVLYLLGGRRKKAARRQRAAGYMTLFIKEFVEFFRHCVQNYRFLVEENRISTTRVYELADTGVLADLAAVSDDSRLYTAVVRAKWRFYQVSRSLDAMHQALDAGNGDLANAMASKSLMYFLGDRDAIYNEVVGDIETLLDGCIGMKGADQVLLDAMEGTFRKLKNRKKEIDLAAKKIREDLAKKQKEKEAEGKPEGGARAKP